eukprot:TRINITY_DN5205_c0_g1_i1.p1 TRINITY_DN5205_c0_g1~~TRINITY_DN5205_c0_g1_i1.p1  ORF type:complete len:166 (+),score=65.67 TRINITY_DN5205_c0_g1_i1:59-499(+)
MLSLFNKPLFYENFEFKNKFQELEKFNPKMDIVENEKEIQIDYEMAGISPEDIEIEFNKGLLTVKGNKTIQRDEKDEDGHYKYYERSSGSFSRSVRLPKFINEEHINADFDNGLLKITINKPAPEELDEAPKKISITSKKNNNNNN